MDWNWGIFEYQKVSLSVSTENNESVLSQAPFDISINKYQSMHIIFTYILLFSSWESYRCSLSIFDFKKKNHAINIRSLCGCKHF